MHMEAENIIVCLFVYVFAACFNLFLTLVLYKDNKNIHLVISLIPLINILFFTYMFLYLIYVILYNLFNYFKGLYSSIKIDKKIGVLKSLNIFTKGIINDLKLW